MFLVLSINSSVAAEKWISSQDEDPMTDALRATVSYGTTVLAESKSIVVRCGYSFDHRDALDMIIGWNEYFADSPAPSLKFRFDKNNPDRLRSDVSTNHTALFIPDDQEREFLTSMRKSSRLVLQVTPYQEGIQTWIVDLNGFETAWNEHCAAIAENAPVKNFEVEPSSSVPEGRTCSPRVALDFWKQNNPGMPVPPPSVAPTLPCPDEH
ncbi:MAG: hypothetical protein RQ826_13630 [Xanthomonadales bacterium]|nr:hypothetical protein [Xanthomonadales bacterium]